MRNTFKNPLPPKDSPIYLCACAHESREKAYLLDTYTEENYTVYYIAEGDGFAYVNRLRYKLATGDLLVVYPHDVISLSLNAPQKASLAQISFAGTFVESYLSDLDILRDEPVQKRAGTLLEEAVRECLRYVDHHATAPSAMMLNSFALKALAAFEPAVETPPALDRSSAYADMAVQYIQDNYQNGINITDVVAHLEIERSYFYRVFIKRMGVSPQQYLLDYRLDRARELLSRGTSVTDTAEAVGIGNIYGFSAIFKKKFGFPPSHLIMDTKESTAEKAPRKAPVSTTPKKEIPVVKPQPAEPKKPGRSLDPWLL